MRKNGKKSRNDECDAAKQEAKRGALACCVVHDIGKNGEQDGACKFGFLPKQSAHRKSNHGSDGEGTIDIYCLVIMAVLDEVIIAQIFC